MTFTREEALEIARLSPFYYMASRKNKTRVIQHIMNPPEINHKELRRRSREILRGQFTH